jgi:hypothetical protein
MKLVLFVAVAVLATVLLNGDAVDAREFPISFSFFFCFSVSKFFNFVFFFFLLERTMVETQTGDFVAMAVARNNQHFLQCDDVRH